MIYTYEIIAPVTNRKIPYLDSKGFFIVPNVIKLYNYYIEVKRYNPTKFCYEYFLLLGVNKFDSQCRKCRVDDYARLKAKLHGEFMDYTSSIMTARGNINMEYVESVNEYDVWELS